MMTLRVAINDKVVALVRVRASAAPNRHGRPDAAKTYVWTCGGRTGVVTHRQADGAARLAALVFADMADTQDVADGRGEGTADIRPATRMTAAARPPAR